jgi:hypothetical protein
MASPNSGGGERQSYLQSIRAIFVITIAIGLGHTKHLD